MAGRKSDFTLTKLDDLFTTQAQRDHICEFAEKMELNGSKVEPINQSEPSKNKTRNREKQR